MLLSIGMIVKNEEKYLERCLTALKPILDELDSELIIADTGSTDNTVEIAKRFTENVYHFEWVNDFAAARNSTIERASGDWYMFIDADEILQDCKELIRFFKSGEYKQYVSASFVVRNYIDEIDTEFYSDFRAYRLMTTRGGIKFENPVHEVLSPHIAPCKYLSVVADHYGYVYYKKGVLNDFAKKKGERNLELLFKELEQAQSDGTVRELLYDQIADSYGIMGMREKSLEYINKGLDSTDPNSIIMILYYNHKLSTLYALDRYEDIIELGNQYFSKKNTARKKTLASDCFVYAMRGLSRFSLKDRSGAIGDLSMCVSLFRQYEKGKLLTEDLLTGAFRATLPVIKACYKALFRSCILENKFDAAVDAAKIFPLSQCLADRSYMRLHLLQRIDVMEHTNYNRLVDLYINLDNYNKQMFIRMMRWQFFKTDKHEQILRKLGEITKGNEQLTSVFSIFRHYFVLKDLTAECVSEYINKYSSRENEDVWCLMMLADYDITPYITDCNFNSEQCTRGVYFNYLDSFNAAELFADYNINALSSNGLEKAASVYGWAMIGAMQNDVDVTRLFEKFGEIGKRWRECYPDSENVPGDIKAATMVNDIVSARESGDYERCIGEMRRLAAANPTFARIVNEYRQVVEYEARSAAPKAPTEFEQLAAQVKRNIREMIGAGQLAEAESTLLELEELCPLDPEIEKLKDEIYELKR